MITHVDVLTGLEPGPCRGEGVVVVTETIVLRHGAALLLIV